MAKKGRVPAVMEDAGQCKNRSIKKKKSTQTQKTAKCHEWLIFDHVRIQNSQICMNKGSQKTFFPEIND